MPSSRRLKVSCGLTAVLLALSIIFNFVLTKALHESFSKLHFARIFPLGYVPIDRTTIGGSATNHSVSFWGDSRAFFWDQFTPSQTLTVHNYAHGGVTSSQLVLQLQTQPPVLTDYAVVQIGINDLHPLGALANEKQHVLDQLRRNILAVRDALLARSRVVVLTTLFPPGRVSLSRRFSWDSATLQHVQEVNDIIRQAADGKHAVLLDAHALLRGPDSYLADRFVDSDFFLHVNREAYLQLNQRLQQIVQEHLPPPRN